MKDKFEDKLARATGKIRRVTIDDPHRRFRDGLLYYVNKAERLRDSAMALERGDPASPHFEAFALLAGFSLEVLIKGILKGLDEKYPYTHNLVTLAECAGFELSVDDRTVLELITVYTTWYARYPAAKKAEEMIEGLEKIESQYPRAGNLKKIVDELRNSPRAVNSASYERLFGFFHQRFFEVQSAVYESAEWSRDLSDE